jgi:hypothetical protein
MRPIDAARRPLREAWLPTLAGALIALLLVACSGQTAVPPSANPVTTALFIDADTVIGPTNLTNAEKPLKTCVQVSRFAHNEEVVWRVKVLDPVTNQAMDDTALASVQVKLPDQTLDLHYGGHPRDTPLDFFWTVGWDVPETYPTGTVEYTIEARAADGRSGTWEQFKVSLAQLTITEEVREILPQ